MEAAMQKECGRLLNAFEAREQDFVASFDGGRSRAWPKPANERTIVYGDFENKNRTFRFPKHPQFPLATRG